MELLVPLTWPYEIDPVQATVNHHRHGAYIQLAQMDYKRAILHYDRAKILQTAVRTALPSMAVPRKERTPRDEGVIRIVLYFLRNLVMLSPPRNIASNGEEPEMSRSAVIDVLQEQDIFAVLLSVASSIGEDFVVQDVAILEILFYLLKGIDSEKLFMEYLRLNETNTQELKSIIQKEKAMLAGYARHAPSRHNRFGSMIWVRREDNKVSTLSGQDVLGQAQRTIDKMNDSKKWNKPQTGRKHHAGQDEFDLPVPLSSRARKYLMAFVEDFLDSSFNPLFLHLRKAIDGEAPRVEERHTRQFFYLVAWFLRAECARRRKPRDTNNKSADDESYGLIAEVMNQETFIFLNRWMQTSQDEKAWLDLNAVMKCFTQILHTVQEMADSLLEDDQEIAENIQNRIFYEETTHDRIVAILRNYKDQGFGYLDACTELAHVFLRMLERYSKQNVNLQVRSRQRRRKKREPQNQDGETHASDGDEAAMQRIVTERKFDFARFSAKFVNQSSVNTFVSFVRYYRELDADQLKRAHRFFYRVAFKMELSLLLFRVDILQLFHKMIKGQEGLDPDSPCFREWEEFVRHLFRAAVKKVQKRPEIMVEMLFSKIPQTMHYLEHGYDRALPTRAPRAPAELEVKPGMDEKGQIGVAVGVLLDQHKADAVRWLQDVLLSALEERGAWELQEDARKASAGAEDAPVPQEEPTPPSIRKFLAQ